MIADSRSARRLVRSLQTRAGAYGHL